MSEGGAREKGRVLYLLIALGAYLVGSVPSGYLIGRVRGVDIRKEGSGNIGATNALRVLGKGWGYFCFACDIAKGFLAVFLARTVVADALDLEPAWSGIVAAVMVIVGHNFPVWLGFKGGKGIATSGGVILGLFPWPAFVIPLATWVLLFYATRYVSVASITCAIMVPVSLAGLWLAGWPGSDGAYVVVGVLMAAMAVWRHRENVKRLLAGTETKFVKRKAKDV
ncbi:MAG: glycerol-3-phosphate 1-O-acyltransferase PlsY [Chthoniobacterales bacterium]